MQEFLKILTARILRSTFERHRLAVAMHMLRFLTPLASNTSNQTVSQFNIASPEEWALLLTGANVLTASEPQSTATGAVCWVALTIIWHRCTCEVPSACKGSQVCIVLVNKVLSVDKLKKMLLDQGVALSTYPQLTYLVYLKNCQIQVHFYRHGFQKMQSSV